MRITVRGAEAYVYTGARAISPGAPAVLFIHGAGMDHTVWNLQSRYFAHHGHGALAVDLPGHGRSAGPSLSSIDRMSAWVLDLLEALDLDRAALVGHSMGALVALDAAGRAPERARALALLGVTAPMPVSDALLAAASAGDHAAFDMINLWGHAGRAHLGGSPSPGMWMTGGGIRLLERSAPGVLFADLGACNDYTTGLDRARAVRCPTLLVQGRADLMTPPRAAAALADALGGPEVAPLDCGHMMMSERPGELLDALAAFIPSD